MWLRGDFLYSRITSNRSLTTNVLPETINWKAWCSMFIPSRNMYKQQSFADLLLLSLNISILWWTETFILRTYNTDSHQQVSNRTTTNAVLQEKSWNSNTQLNVRWAFCNTTKTPPRQSIYKPVIRVFLCKVKKKKKKLNSLLVLAEVINSFYDATAYFNTGLFCNNKSENFLAPLNVIRNCHRLQLGCAVPSASVWHWLGITQEWLY